nr:hypothetical protein Iba_chr09bCG12640 [Ipomoea batatas]
MFIGPYVTRLIRNAHLTIVQEIQEAKVGEGMIVMDRVIILWIFQEMRVVFKPGTRADKRARVAKEMQKEEEMEEEGGAAPEADEGSSGSTFQQQVLSQLASHAAPDGDIYSKVENLETGVGCLEARAEASAYQT